MESITEKKVYRVRYMAAVDIECEVIIDAASTESARWEACEQARREQSLLGSVVNWRIIDSSAEEATENDR